MLRRCLWSNMWSKSPSWPGAAFTSAACPEGLFFIFRFGVLYLYRGREARCFSSQAYQFLTRLYKEYAPAKSIQQTRSYRIIFCVQDEGGRLSMSSAERWMVLPEHCLPQDAYPKKRWDTGCPVLALITLSVHISHWLITACTISYTRLRGHSYFSSAMLSAYNSHVLIDRNWPPKVYKRICIVVQILLCNV